MCRARPLSSDVECDLMVICLFSDRHGKTAVDLAWHPVMKEALKPPRTLDTSLNTVSFHLDTQ